MYTYSNNSKKSRVNTNDIQVKDITKPTSETDFSNDFRAICLTIALLYHLMMS